MTPFPDTSHSWVQSLLVVSAAPLPGSSLMQQTSYQDAPALTEISTAVADAHQTGVMASEFAAARPLYERAATGPFWPSADVTFRTPLHLLGNEVVVREVPFVITFIAHTVIWAANQVACSWEVHGPKRDTEGSSLITRVQKDVTPIPLGRHSHFDMKGVLGIGVARPVIRATVTDEGLHTIVLFLDGHEATRIPLLVLIAS